MDKTYKIYILIIFVLAAITGFGQKNDTLYFHNGDKITCEIRTFQYGYFTVKTTAMSTIYVKFDKIATIYSGKTFEIALDDKSRVFGTIDTSGINGTIYINIITGKKLKYLSSIVEMTPIKNKFWRRFSGNIDIGYSYTQSTKISQLTYSSLLEYRPKNYDFKLSSSALFSAESGNQVSKKNNIDLTAMRYLKKRWLGFGSVGTEENSELGLKLRIQGILGFGNDLIHTKSNQLLTAVGISVNQEISTDTTKNTINNEGVILVSYKLFIISIPKFNIISTFLAYPSFTVKDRWRVSYKLSINSEIISNLTIGVSLDYSFDNKPPSETSTTSNINISSSVGFSFY